MKTNQRTKSSIVVWGIYLTAFTFPLDFPIMGGVTLFRLMAFLAIYSWLLYILMNQKKKIHVNKVTLFAVFFVAFGLLSSFWASSQHHILKTIMLLLLFIGFYLIAIDTISTKLMFNRFGLSYLLGCLLAGATVILKAIFGFIPAGERVAAFSHQNLNVFGATMAMGILVIIYLFKNTKRRQHRLLLLGAFVILLIALFLSGSRMAWLSLIISVVLSINIALKAVSLKKAITAVLFITFFTGGCLYSFVYLNLFTEKLTSHLLARMTPSYSIQDKGAQRLGIFLIGWKMFKDAPIVGVGLQNFKVAAYERCPNLMYLVNYVPIGGPHNMYLSVLVELGIIGVLLWFSLLGFSFRYALYCRNPSGRHFAFSTLVFLVVAGLFATPQIFGWFWLSLALSNACSRAHNLERLRQFRNLT